MDKIRRWNRLYLCTYEVEIPYKPHTFWLRVKLWFVALPKRIRFNRAYPSYSLDEIIDCKLKPIYVISIGKIKFVKVNDNG